MPPKKRLIHDQITLFGVAAPTSSLTSSSKTETPTRPRWRGNKNIWRNFSQLKWKERFPWLDVGEDGVHCPYCTKGTARVASGSGSEVFISMQYAGVRPGVLKQHTESTAHQDSTMAYRESIERSVKKRRLADIVISQESLTVDGEAFCNALNWLVKHEIPHTSNYGPFVSFTLLGLGAQSLSRLAVAKNHTYGSEQSMVNAKGD